MEYSWAYQKEDSQHHQKQMVLPLKMLSFGTWIFLQEIHFWQVDNILELSFIHWNFLDADAWVPSTNDLNQFIQADLIEMIPVYGLEVEGSSHLASYTTSISVLYSLDGSIFSPIYDNTNHEKVLNIQSNNYE